MGDKIRWYDRESGCIVDKVPMKTPVKEKDENGQLTGVVRTTTGATLTHAKKQGLLPSVTSVLDGVLTGGKGLEKWLMEQRILACISNPFEGDAKDEDVVKQYIGMINIKADEYAKASRERGNVMHADLNKWIKSDRTELPEDPACKEMCIQLHSYFESKGVVSISTETSISDPDLGFAGTPDIFCICANESKIVIDLKSAEFRDKKIEYYPKWKFQLGGYRNLLPDANDALLVQAVADRTYGDVVLKEYDEEKGNWSEGYTNLFNAWCIMANYDPRKWAA